MDLNRQTTAQGDMSVALEGVAVAVGTAPVAGSRGCCCSGRSY